MTRHQDTTRYTPSSLVARAATFALAAVMTTVVLAGVGSHADREYDRAVLAQAATAPTMLVQADQLLQPRV